MGKRKLAEIYEDEPESCHGSRGGEHHNKRNSRPDRISGLSTELSLRVLSFLPAPDLLECQRLSHHFYTLAGDSQLWKAHYYNRFVRPRAQRIPGLKDSGVAAQSLYFSSKLSRWLDDEILVKRGQETNWKKQYKTRHNWTKGTCGVREVPVAESASVPPLLVQMHESTIFMADHVHGLRACATKSGGSTIIAETSLAHVDADADADAKPNPPSALAVNTLSKSTGPTVSVAIAFQDGSFSIYELNLAASAFKHRYTHPPSSNGTLSAIALSFPYLATMTANQILSLYKFADFPTDTSSTATFTFGPPRLLHSLHSLTVCLPMTLSIRQFATCVLLAIAYAHETFSGWTVAIQELRIDASPASSTTTAILDSRLATALDTQYRPLNSILPSTPEHPNTAPTHISYTHPYLLAAHPDNTLTLHLVSSTTTALRISPATRLWGHTSAVAAATVGPRGRAVSVARRGMEVRIWELEGGLAASASASAAGATGERRRGRGGGRAAVGDVSVRVRPTAPSPGAEEDLTAQKQPDAASTDKHKARESQSFGLALGPVVLEQLKQLKQQQQQQRRRRDSIDETNVATGWVAFDDEKVVVLKEKSGGAQALVLYDFTT